VPAQVARLIEDHMSAALRGETTTLPELSSSRTGSVWEAQASRAEIHATSVDLSELARAAVAALRRHDADRQVEASIEDGVQVLGDE
jgi:hypothetical protein